MNQTTRCVVLLDNYTMILPIRERVQYLDRFFDYHRDYPIIAIDSSKADNAAYASKYGNVDYRWLGPAGHFKKMLDALDRVDTAYVSIGSDDDFHITVGIADCIRILQNSPETICAHGANVNFEETPRPNILYRNHKTLLRNRNLAGQRPHASPLERFTCFYKALPYSPYNAVYRTDKLKKIISIMLDCGFDKPGANDYGFAFVALMFGNFMGSKELFCLKNLEAPPVRNMVNIPMVDFWEQLLAAEAVWKTHYDPQQVRRLIPEWKSMIADQTRRETAVRRILFWIAPYGVLRLVRPYALAARSLKQIFDRQNAMRMISPNNSQ